MKSRLTREGHWPCLLGLDGSKPHYTTNLGQESTKIYRSIHLRGISEFALPIRFDGLKVILGDYKINHPGESNEINIWQTDRQMNSTIGLTQLFVV